MNKKVVAVGPEWTVEETVEFLTQHHIGGSPVVDDEGKLVGMISELALIDVVFDHSLKHVPIFKYMNTELQIISPDAPLSRAAQLFALYSFRRLPIVENGKLVGIISRRDLMNFSLRTNQPLEDPLTALIPSLAAIADCEADAVSIS